MEIVYIYYHLLNKNMQAPHQLVDQKLTSAFVVGGKAVVKHPSQFSAVTRQPTFQVASKKSLTMSALENSSSMIPAP